MSAENLAELETIFNAQKNAYSPSNVASYAERIDMLDRMDKMVRANLDEINQAMVEDFGSRAPDWVFTADIYPVLAHIKHTKKLLKGWMKPERKKDGFLYLTGQRTYIKHEALGVVGIITPFNAPVSLGFGPAIDAISAGNRVMIKFSEDNPAIAKLMKKAVSEHFKAEELAVIEGGIEVAIAFGKLPWDNLFFTGGTEVGKKVMTAAGANLTPVILELGGKSPCILLDDANIEEAAKKIGIVRLLNAGQVCISADYVLIPDDKLDQFVETAMAAEKETYPRIIDNPNYTSVINDRQFDRITSWIDEARESGAKIIQAERIGEILPDKTSRKIPLTIVVNPSADLKVSKEEIFGPILTIFTYSKLNEVIEQVNSRSKALALYIFGQDPHKIEYIVSNTSSGGITINDLMMHAGSNTMGFGGVGASGMGRYKGGKIGFEAFSNPKAVHEQGLMRKFTMQFMPPYKKPSSGKMLRSQVGL